MENFEKLKSELTEKAKAKGACMDQYRRALSANDQQSLLSVIFDNVNWCHNNEVVTYEWLLNFNLEALIKSGLANTGVDNKGYGNAGNDNAGSRNAGYSNAGNDNAGNDNAGNYNAGNDNAGNYNAGNDNAGNDNAGNYNAGSRNAGNDNAGSRNAGSRNAGYSNAGNYNAGNYNAGSRNAGYSNAGNDNAGAFNSLCEFKLFNKACKKTTFESFSSSKAFRLLHEINTSLWVPSSSMSKVEKLEFAYHETTGGYNRQIPYKEAFCNSWNNWSDANKLEFTSLENFDATVFFEITGVTV